MTTTKKFFPIGTLVNYGDIRLVVEATPENKPMCEGCSFTPWNRKKKGRKDISCYIHRLDCSAFTRRDHYHVIFREL